LPPRVSLSVPMVSSPAGLPIPQLGQPCSCGSGKLFENCCEPLLRGPRRALTAEELMRSRFTAHVTRNFAYLHRTYLPTARLPYVEATEESPIHWSRLVVHAHEPGNTPDQAFVDFSAFFVDDTGEHSIQEKSEFLRTDGEWFYTRAVRTGPAPIRSTPKPGRNDPCPCGSGKKYKQCCLGKSQAGS